MLGAREVKTGETSNLKKRLFDIVEVDKEARVSKTAAVSFRIFLSEEGTRRGSMANFSLKTEVVFFIMLLFHLFSDPVLSQDFDDEIDSGCKSFPEPPFVCDKTKSPVCASDGKTYNNYCTFCFANRESHGKITLKHFDKC
ncbi:serine protease inhibitor Kazal-type 6-like isoform X2 [Sciurus carolinensis]|uniref:serine protease inhibitor Kazal-type 6-like isoform X2 n=1 Tax=Sciurus carolinensis TaxID=30640 RepID=UPI001FB1B284|nr:serine protease inhibitor Kazal-type 6-like isoform X2 [Sciurus carolinensis]